LFAREIFCLRRNDRTDPRYLRDLHIKPSGEDESFKPKKDNWRRAAKVPLLFLNATTLNTGHNWRFTASWMGEPAGPINSETDGNVRLRQVRFTEAPRPWQSFPIGCAVAASACVPGLLEPIAVHGLYPDLTVRLVDGGSSEPLATSPLIEQGCTFLIVSDASGNTDAQVQIGTASVAVALRSNRISTSHLRQAQYNALAARQESSLVQGLMFVHLKKDLEGSVVEQIGSAENTNDTSASDGRSAPLTSYGIRKDVQQGLAVMRSELDTFSDTEAYALMTSGYLITEAVSQEIKGWSRQQTNRPDWCFLAIEEQMKRVGDSEILRQIAVAQNRFAKIWKLSGAAWYIPPLFMALVIVFVIAAYDPLKNAIYAPNSTFFSDLALYAFLLLYLTVALISLGTILLGPVLFVVLLALKIRRREKTLGQIIRGLGALFFGWIGACFQLLVIDKLYLALGNIKDRRAAIISTADEKAKNWRQNIQQTVGQKIDSGVSQSIVKALNRSETIDAVSKLLEAGGYEVARFPRDRQINPFQLNLDLFASKGNRRIFADVKTGPTLVDWKDASGLKAAASLLSNLKETEPSKQEAVDTMLFLIDVPPDESLRQFSETEGVKVVRMDGDSIKRILANRGDISKLQTEADRLDLFDETDKLSNTSPAA